MLAPGFRKVVVCALALAAACLAATRTSYRIHTVAGTEPICDACPSGAVQLAPPQGIAVDRERNVYISVTDHHRVYKITPRNLIYLVAGTGKAGSSGDGGPAMLARLNMPYGLALDAAGNLYIADKDNHRVRCVGLDGNISTVAGNGEKGAQGDGGPASAAQLMSPHHLVFDGAGNLYISEFDGHRVRRVAKDGTISTVAGNGMAGLRGDGAAATAAQLNYPAGLAVDPAGALYVADTNNQRIRRVLPGGLIETYKDLSEISPYAQPVGLALDANGWLYVADRGTPCVRAYRPSPHYEVIAGKPETSGYGGDGGPAKEALLTRVNDLVFGTDGTLYIADHLRVRKLANGMLSTIAGDAYTWNIGDRGPATAAHLRNPAGLAMDPPGNLYIADSENQRIRKLTRNGEIVTIVGNGRMGFQGDHGLASAAMLYSPRGLALDPTNNLYIADSGSNRVRQMLSVGIILTAAGYAATSSMGADGGLAVSTPLLNPKGLCADARGNVYVADSGHHRVFSFDPSGIVHMLAGNGSEGYTGDRGKATLAQLRDPTGLAVDSAGNLFIADSGNHAIRKVDAAGMITTVLAAGVLDTPRGLALDGNGNLFIADTGHNLIRQLSPDGALRTIAGTGTADFCGDGGPALQACLNAPWAVMVDGSGSLYVSDAGNNRVRRLTPVTETGPETVTAVVVNAASLAAGPVAPGELVSVSAAMEATLETTRVLFDGVPAKLVSAQTGRVVAQVPAAVAGRSMTILEVQHNNETRAQTTLPVAKAAPGLFTSSGGATGQATAVNADGTPNGAENPAPRGSVISLFGTGEGLEPLEARVGGTPAEVIRQGPAQGLVGVFQLDIRIPAGFAPYGTLEVEVAAGGATSQRGVTVVVAP